MFVLPSHLWAPQRRGVLETIDALTQRNNDVCLFSPTGGGKTVQAITLMQWAPPNGWGACFYVNRKLLVSQTAARFASAGLHYGIRAADYEDQYDYYAPMQICSIDTERSRVGKQWTLHDAKLVIVDEAHIQKSQTMWETLQEYRQMGAYIVLLTATPVGLSDWADELVVSGSLAEYRACKALVPAVVKSINQPDMSKVKRSDDGEYVMNGQKKKLYTQYIVGDVVDNWRIFNPDARPTMMYAPGKPESVFLTEQFRKIGVNFCHVDATDALLDGKRVKLTRKIWSEILERYEKNDIKGLSSRFKLREGIDVPSTYHAILATPIGSLASYIQTVGRVIRYSAETPDSVLITDHGGNYWRHGSPNSDRPWKTWWDLPEHAVSEWHQNEIREQREPEPIRCPNCKGERKSGHKCPHCGFEHPKGQREVVMEDGSLRTVDGPMIKPRRIKCKPDTEDLWAKLFWGYRKKKLDLSFRQMEAFFIHENHYSPPRDLQFMPQHPEDWFRPVHGVDLKRLHGGEEYLASKGRP